MNERRKTDERCINALRFLACDAVEKANSGHPGLPLGAAAMAYTLWTRRLRHDPTEPAWPDRDRFVLSAGHGSALLYSLLHLSGYDLPLEELQAFRQWDSRTPGHPESHIAPGVEATTGPLGQGLASAVGMAIAERHLAATFNRPGHEIVDHHTYVIASDGDLMEGVAYEACALAGHLRLGKLIVLFDSNDISLAGSTSLVTSEAMAARFEAAGWQVLEVADGNDVDEVDRALAAAEAERDRPSLLVVSTIIGYGAPTKQGTFGVHGAPLGAEELTAAKEALGWPTEPAFFVPDDVRAQFAAIRDAGKQARQNWQAALERYRAAHPELARELERRLRGELPEGWADDLPRFEANAKGLPTRKASHQVLQALTARLPELMGGSADLNPSTLTTLSRAGDFQSPRTAPASVQGTVGETWGYEGRNLHFGVREHAMGAVAGGMALHGGVIPYTGTFLVFSDYMRPPMRLAALSGYPVIFVFTHDSIGVGEDGPTHQPVEHLMSLRLIPSLVVVRPADANETAEAWRVAIERRDGPTVLVLSRQALPVLDRAEVAAASGLSRGGYVLWESGPQPDLIVLATGSEVHLALEAGRSLAREGHRVRVVSLPSWELFEAQPEEYRRQVLPEGTRRLAVEAGRGTGWERYVGCAGRILAVEQYGMSAPGSEVLARYGFTVEQVLQEARRLLKS